MPDINQRINIEVVGKNTNLVDKVVADLLAAQSLSNKRIEIPKLDISNFQTSINQMKSSLLDFERQGIKTAKAISSAFRNELQLLNSMKTYQPVNQSLLTEVKRIMASQGMAAGPAQRLTQTTRSFPATISQSPGFAVGPTRQLPAVIGNAIDDIIDAEWARRVGNNGRFTSSGRTWARSGGGIGRGFGPSSMDQEWGWNNNPKPSGWSRRTGDPWWSGGANNNTSPPGGWNSGGSGNHPPPPPRRPTGGGGSPPPNNPPPNNPNNWWNNPQGPYPGPGGPYNNPPNNPGGGGPPPPPPPNGPGPGGGPPGGPPNNPPPNGPGGPGRFSIFGNPLGSYQSNYRGYNPLRPFTDANGKSKFNTGNFSKPEVLQQLGFAALFGGPTSLIGAGIGAGFGGPTGALLGSTLTQTIANLVEAPLEKFKDAIEGAREAGIAFERSILGITAVRQSTTEVIDSRGRSVDLPLALAFQSSKARETQLAARAKLLPLGIAGATESTFVQGIQSALAQRGLQASPQQIARISELIGGAIQTQRPSLLDNTTLLLRDIQDVVGGGPLASRTVLSQLIRPALGGIKTAKTTEQFVGALESLDQFSKTATGLENPVSVLNKFTGALDNLKTVAGDSLVNITMPAIKTLTAEISKPETIEAFTNIASAFGKIISAQTIAASHLVDFSVTMTNSISMPVIKALPLLAALGAAVVGIAGVRNSSSLIGEQFSLAKSKRAHIAAQDIEARAVLGLAGNRSFMNQGSYEDYLANLNNLGAYAPSAISEREFYQNRYTGGVSPIHQPTFGNKLGAAYKSSGLRGAAGVVGTALATQTAVTSQGLGSAFRFAGMVGVPLGLAAGLGYLSYKAQKTEQESSDQEIKDLQKQSFLANLGVKTRLNSEATSTLKRLGLETAFSAYNEQNASGPDTKLSGLNDLLEKLQLSKDKKDLNEFGPFIYDQMIAAKESKTQRESDTRFNPNTLSGQAEAAGFQFQSLTEQLGLLAEKIKLLSSNLDDPEGLKGLLKGRLGARSQAKMSLDEEQEKQAGIQAKLKVTNTRGLGFAEFMDGLAEVLPGLTGLKGPLELEAEKLSAQSTLSAQEQGKLKEDLKKAQAEVKKAPGDLGKQNAEELANTQRENTKKTLEALSEIDTEQSALDKIGQRSLLSLSTETAAQRIIASQEKLKILQGEGGGITSKIDKASKLLFQGLGPLSESQQKQDDVIGKKLQELKQDAKIKGKEISEQVTSVIEALLGPIMERETLLGYTKKGISTRLSGGQRRTAQLEVGTSTKNLENLATAAYEARKAGKFVLAEQLEAQLGAERLRTIEGREAINKSASQRFLDELPQYDQSKLGGQFATNQQTLFARGTDLTNTTSELYKLQNTYGPLTPQDQTRMSELYKEFGQKIMATNQAFDKTTEAMQNISNVVNNLSESARKLGDAEFGKFDKEKNLNIRGKLAQNALSEFDQQSTLRNVSATLGLAGRAGDFQSRFGKLPENIGSDAASALLNPAYARYLEETKAQEEFNAANRDEMNRPLTESEQRQSLVDAIGANKTAFDELTESITKAREAFYKQQNDTFDQLGAYDYNITDLGKMTGPGPLSKAGTKSGGGGNLGWGLDPKDGTSYTGINPITGKPFTIPFNKDGSMKPQNSGDKLISVLEKLEKQGQADEMKTAIAAGMREAMNDFA